MTLRKQLAWGGLALMTLAAQAQDTFQIGFQQSLIQPVGAVHTKEGLPHAVGIGLHSRFILSPGHVLQPRLDLCATGRIQLRSWNAQGMELTSSQLSVTGISLELNYLYFPAKQPTGWYVAAGLGKQRWDRFGTGSSSVASTGGGADQPWVETRWEPSQTLHHPDNRSLLATLGGGYQFTPRTGLELRLAHSRIGRTDVTANTLQLGVTFSF